MGITTTQAETEIYKKIGQFTGVEKNNLRFNNQPLQNGQVFTPPQDKLWCKVFINYSDSFTSEISNKPLIRDFGIISIQCFAPKDAGTLKMSMLVDQWRDFLQSFGVPFMEIYKVHAAQDMADDNFYAKIVRAEFRIN